MDLRLGSLREALIEAGDLLGSGLGRFRRGAGSEDRLTRLMTLAQVTIGLLLVLLGSQAALWAQMSTLSGRVARLSAQVDPIARATAP